MRQAPGIRAMMGPVDRHSLCLVLGLVGPGQHAGAEPPVDRRDDPRVPRVDRQPRVLHGVSQR